MTVNVKQISSMEKVFLDVAPNSEDFANATVLKGERFSYQIALCQQENEFVYFDFKIKNNIPCTINIYEVSSVAVTLPCYQNHDNNYLRTTPGVYPDILYPKVDNSLKLAHSQWKSLWITFDVPENIDSGE